MLRLRRSKKMRHLLFVNVSLMFLFVLAGCHWRPEPEPQIVLPQLDILPNPNFIVVRGEYQAKAIDAAGGIQAWMKVAKIERNCVVTFYMPDGSYYLTEQTHEVFPWSNSIQVSSKEPQGSYAWQYCNGRFKTLEGCDWSNCLPAELDPNSFAKALMDITTSPARFFDGQLIFSNEPRPIRLEGQFYFAISQISVQTGREVRGFFYQNRDSGLIDITAFGPDNLDELISVRGYNYGKADDSGILVPNKIEIFKSGIDGIFQKRIVEIEYKSK